MTSLHHSIRRLTVSAYELGCLGLLHGTRARVRRAMGRPDPEPVELTQEMLKRPTTGSLEIKPAWPRDLAIIGLAALAAATMIAVVATATPKEPPPLAVAAAPAPAAVADDNAPALAAKSPAADEPALDTKPAKKTKKAKKNRRPNKKKKRKRGRRR